jgi:hypothetical protein
MIAGMNSMLGLAVFACQFRIVGAHADFLAHLVLLQLQA